MKIIVEVDGDDHNRYFRIEIPDGCKLTWQGVNPASKNSMGQGNCLRIYEKGKQIMVIPDVLTWRRDDIIVEEFVQQPNTIGKSWKDKRDAPMIEEDPRPTNLEVPKATMSALDLGNGDWDEPSVHVQANRAFAKRGRRRRW